MNAKKMKELRRKVKPIQVEWLQSLLPEEQAKTITVSNVEELIPDQTHTFGGGQVLLSYMSDKWIIKQLKKYPHINTYEELRELNEGIHI
tara:strand:+ start:2813 stop:3082 length:270 start_codon:yes stop_codon:yes gene_type:complete